MVVKKTQNPSEIDNNNSNSNDVTAATPKKRPKNWQFLNALCDIDFNCHVLGFCFFWKVLNPFGAKNFGMHVPLVCQSSVSLKLFC